MRCYEVGMDCVCGIDTCVYKGLPIEWKLHMYDDVPRLCIYGSVPKV